MSRPKVADTVKVVCVLRSGGVYTPDYVHALRRAVERHTTRFAEHSRRFVCLSDIPIEGVSTIPLRTDLPGWWAKLEAFRIQGPALYLDLDTVILSNIDPLLVGVRHITSSQLMMLRSFAKREKWASGVMGWRGNFSWLARSLHGGATDPQRFDQKYIERLVLERGLGIVAVQDYIDGLYSYKKHCQEILPRDARIVCFHGKPRPHAVKTPWVQEAWAA